MKKSELTNIPLIFILMLFIFHGDYASAEARSKAYDAKIKSDIQGLIPAMMMCYDENEGSYAGCDTMIIEKYYDGRLPEPPKCSYDEKYNIVISSDGKNYVIWADLVSVDGYWCVDSESEGHGKLVLSDEIPSGQKALCPQDGHYTKKNAKKDCEIRNDNTGLLTVMSLFLSAFFAILCVLLFLINKYYISNKLKLRDILRIAFLSVVIVLLVGIAYFLILGVLLSFFSGLNGEVSFFAGLPVSVFLTYACIKSLFNPYRNIISSSAIIKLSLFILFFDLLIFISAAI